MTTTIAAPCTTLYHRSMHASNQHCRQGQVHLANTLERGAHTSNSRTYTRENAQHHQLALLSTNPAQEAWRHGAPSFADILRALFARLSVLTARVVAVLGSLVASVIRPRLKFLGGTVFQLLLHQLTQRLHDEMLL